MEASQALPRNTAPLPQTAAVPLAATLLDEVAQEADLRCLIIKGVTAVAQGVRPVTALFADVDVLVHPADIAALEAALARRGWVRRPEDNRLHVFPTHSVTLMHASWPCDLDVHFVFPGLGAEDPARAFDLLWKHRVSVDVAHWTVTAPCPLHHAVIIALAAQREPWEPKNAAHLRHLLLGPLGPQDARAPFWDAAEELGAAGALRPFLEDLLPERDATALPPPDPAWLLYTHSRESATVRAIGLLEARGPRRLRLLMDALMPSRQALASQDLTVKHIDSRQLWRLRAQRLLRGVRAVPVVLQDLRDYRRQRSASGDGEERS